MLKKHLLFFLGIFALHLSAIGQQTGMTIGVCMGIEQANTAKNAGFDYIVPTVSSYLKPLVSGEVFAREAHDSLHQAPVKAINSFLPGDLPCFGPQADKAKLLAYAQVVFKRAREKNVSMVVLGSGRSRHVPEGMDYEEALSVFVELCKELADLADSYGVIIALENLNSGETNFVNTVQEAVVICERVNKPNFGINADIYHMLKEGEAAEVLLQAAPYLFWCDIAEPANRTPPGIEGTDFRSYLHILKEVGYTSGITIEAQWADFSTQAAEAYQALSRQVADVYK